MSKRRALMMALRKIVRAPGEAMDNARFLRVREGERAAQRKTMAEGYNLGDIKGSGEPMRGAVRRPARTNASPISVVDNEFDAPVRAAAVSPSLPGGAALQTMPMARLKALFESYMGEPIARRRLTTRKDIIFEMEERARALDAADTIKRHS